MRKKYKNKSWVFIVFLATIFSLAFFSLWQVQPGRQTAQNTARTLSQSCLNQDINKMACQQDYYKAKYLRSGTGQTFTDLKTEYAENTSVKTNCHQITHTIGRMAGEQYGDVGKAYGDGDTFCWSGYYHGVMEAVLQKYENDDVLTKLNEICSGIANEKKYSFPHYNCAHGLGHGLMLILGDELFDSLTACDKLNDNWERESCYGGVFMENIMAKLNPDHNTKYLKDDDALYPCTVVDDKYAVQCYQMQTSHALTVLGHDFRKVFELCEQINKKFQATCQQSIGRDASGQSSSDAETTKATCLLGGSSAAQSNCVIGAVKDFVSFYHSDRQASEFCGLLRQDLKDTCHQTKTEYYSAFPS